MNRIKELRQKKHLTLKQLGKKLNMLDSTLSQYENDKRNPKKEIWQKIADFFGVSIPYLQGLTLDEKEIVPRLIPIIHESYFDTWFFMNSVAKKGKVFHYFSPDLVDNIDIYIVLTSDSKEPWQLYSKGEVEFKLSKKIFKYWCENLSSIFHELAQEELPNSINNMLLLNEFEMILKNRCNEISKNSGVTSLGFFYKNEFDNDDYSENRMHRKMREMILHGNYDLAKKAINEYFQVVSKLKDAVNEFSEDDYFKYRLFNIIIPTQKLDQPSKEKNAIIDEIADRVNSGDNQLLEFIMQHDAENLPRVYGKFKKRNNEDTTELDKYINNPANALPYEMFQNKDFIKYMNNHISSKNTDIQKLYLQFIKDNKTK